MAVQTQEIKTGEKRIHDLQNRTPEQIAEVRLRLLANTTPPRPLPAGMTLEEIVVSQITDDLSEEQVSAILRDL